MNRALSAEARARATEIRTTTVWNGKGTADLLDALADRVDQLWFDILRTQKDQKGGMKVGPLPYYCPFCSWDEKSQVALVKHMAEKHQVICRGLKGST